MHSVLLYTHVRPAAILARVRPEQFLRYALALFCATLYSLLQFWAAVLLYAIVPIRASYRKIFFFHDFSLLYAF